jgi:hypothetical protein
MTSTENEPDESTSAPTEEPGRYIHLDVAVDADDDEDGAQI